jgi:cation transport regulator ChaB
MLEWNSNTELYEANWNGKLMQVSLDAFNTALEQGKQEYMEEGISEEEAEKKAWDATCEAWAWEGSDATI